MKTGRVLVACHATAGQEHLARFAGESQQNDLPAPCINAFLCVVPSSVTALQFLQFVSRPPCVWVVGPTYTLLDGEGVREQGLCFHGLAWLPGKGATKHTGYVEGFWVLGTKCAPGLGKCTPRELLGFAPEFLYESCAAPGPRRLADD